MTTKSPNAVTSWVILEGITHGNRFLSLYDPEKDNERDITKLTSGEVAYEVLGYAETIEDAQTFLYGRPYPLSGVHLVGGIGCKFCYLDLSGESAVHRQGIMLGLTSQGVVTECSGKRIVVPIPQVTSVNGSKMSSLLD